MARSDLFIAYSLYIPLQSNVSWCYLKLEDYLKAARCAEESIRVLGKGSARAYYFLFKASIKCGDSKQGKI